MRWFVANVSFFLMLGAPLAVAGDRPDDQVDTRQVASALLDSPEPSRQVAGLLFSESALPRDAEYRPLLSESEFLDRLHGLIDRADSGLTRALLAQLCSLKGLQADCRQRGLDEAIVRHDGAELWARMYLTERGDSERLREVIVGAQQLEERSMDYALIIFDAFEAEGQLSTESYLAKLAALTIGPGLSPISEYCQQAVINDPTLDSACVRVTQSMIDDARSDLIVMFGSSIMARRAEAAGQSGANARHEAWRASFHEWLSCNYSVAEEVWGSAPTSFVHEFVNHWQERGETSAHAFVAARAGLDCGLPPRSPWSADSSPG